MRGSYQDGSDDQFSGFTQSDKYHTLPLSFFVRTINDVRNYLLSWREESWCVFDRAECASKKSVLLCGLPALISKPINLCYSGRTVREGFVER